VGACVLLTQHTPPDLASLSLNVRAHTHTHTHCASAQATGRCSERGEEGGSRERQGATPSHTVYSSPHTHRDSRCSVSPGLARCHPLAIAVLHTLPHPTHRQSNFNFVCDSVRVVLDGHGDGACAALQERASSRAITTAMRFRVCACPCGRSPPLSLGTNSQRVLCARTVRPHTCHTQTRKHANTQTLSLIRCALCFPFQGGQQGRDCVHEVARSPQPKMG
jgi:hypothetical protein